MSHSKRRYSITGFSLVELSIVLVILGLVVGGIIAGSSLIHTSELKGVVSDIEVYTQATQKFKEKYQYLPGDIPNATKFWGKDTVLCGGDSQPAGTPGTCNGDGNDKIIRNGVEEFRFWQQLSLAGYIPGKYTGSGSGSALRHEAGVNDPETKINGAGISVVYMFRMAGDPDNFDGIYNNVFLLGTHTSGSTYNSDAILTQGDAYNIDSKLDDGKPAYGVVRTFKPVYFPCATTSVSATAVYNTAAATKDARNCSLMFITGY